MGVTTSAPRVSIRFPGRRATDLRIAVTIEEPGLPFPVVVYFVRVIDDEIPGAEALINVGLELGQRFDFPDAGESRPAIALERMPRPLDRQAVELVSSRFRQYVEYARASIALGPRGDAPGMKPSTGRRREMTDDFLSLIAEQFTSWSAGHGRAVSEIARAHGVERSTASRWVSTARRRGFLPPKESDSE